MKKYIVKVGEKEFKSKSALYQFSRSLFEQYRLKINRPKQRMEILGDDLSFTLNLLKRHPSYSVKRGVGIAKVYIGENFSGGTHMLIQRLDDSLVDVSWVQCCHQRRPSKKAELLLAMRTAISSQLLDFKRANKAICATCSTIENLEVDHKTPSFSELADCYLEWVHFYPTVFGQDLELLQLSFLPIHYEFSTLWQTFHLNQAKLQFLCKSCHNIKSKKETEERRIIVTNQ